MSIREIAEQCKAIKRDLDDVEKKIVELEHGVRALREDVAALSLLADEDKAEQVLAMMDFVEGVIN